MKTKNLDELNSIIQYFIGHNDNQPNTDFCKNVDRLINLQAEVANVAKLKDKSGIVCQECQNPHPHIDKNGLAGCEECGNTWQTKA